MKNPLARNQKGASPRSLFQLDNPWTAIKHDMESWFDRNTLATADYGHFDFSPACNMKETNREYMLSFDIPGIKKEDVKIELESNRLTVQGERKEEREEAGEKHYFTESLSGSFMRSFTLPSNINDANVEASYKNGVLTVRVPKDKPSKSKKIDIQ